MTLTLKPHQKQSFTSSSPLGLRSTAVKPYILEEGQNWKFKLGEQNKD